MPPTSPPVPAPGPSITDWLQGVGTVAGAVIALLAVAAAILAYRTQNEQLRHQQKQIADQQGLNKQQSEVLQLQADELSASLDERRRAQVVQVFLEFSSERRGPDAPTGPHQYFRAVLTNMSSLPIYDLTAKWFTGTEPWTPDSDDLALSHLRHREASPGVRIPPYNGDERHIAMWRAVHRDADDAEAVTMVAEFRDAAERWWRIWPTGRIEEIEPPKRS